MRSTTGVGGARVGGLRWSGARGVTALVLALLLVASGCSADPGPASDDPSEGEAGSGATAGSAAPDPGPQPEISRLTQAQWRRIVAAGMVRPECPIQRPNQLRSVRINHVTFDGSVRRGQLVVNADVAESVARVFSRLYRAGFPIRRMRPVEAYGGDTNASLAADNTSAFNCRRADQINAPFRESPHANGRAVDINPRENPWLDLRCDCWTPSPKDRKRDAEPGKIRKGGLVWRAFRREGWIWQNIDVPDYMHFDTGYPSRPFRSRRG